MSSLAALQTIITNLEAAKADAEKFDAGNKSAGTRVRKAAQEGKKALDTLRKEVQAAKTAETGDSK